MRMDQPKIERLLRLMKMLTGNVSYTVKELKMLKYYLNRGNMKPVIRVDLSIFFASVIFKNTLLHYNWDCFPLRF
jgi:hypothetical protein